MVCCGFKDVATNFVGSIPHLTRLQQTLSENAAERCYETNTGCHSEDHHEDKLGLLVILTLLQQCLSHAWGRGSPFSGATKMVLPSPSSEQKHLPCMRKRTGCRPTLRSLHSTVASLGSSQVRTLSNGAQPNLLSSQGLSYIKVMLK